MLHLIKYALEGLAVAMATSLISRKMDVRATLLLALSAMAVFIILDMFAPLTASGARHGTGFGLGFNLVGGQGQEQDGGSPPDMCGGGLIEAIQQAGGEPSSAAFAVPFKIVKGQYGTSIQAGFNESAVAYNEEGLEDLASY